MNCTLALDVGTSATKCVIFGEKLRMLAETDASYDTVIQHPSWAEQNAEDWWKAVCDTIQRAIAASNIKPGDIKAVMVSGQAPSALIVDRSGKPMHPALIWMDRRSGDECEEFALKIAPDRVYEITGLGLDPCYTLAELLWLKKHYPEIIGENKYALQANGYILYKLTGEFTIDVVSASQTQLLDLNTQSWSTEIFDAAELPESLMPRIVQCSEVAGSITLEASRATGLMQGTPVLGGTVDASAAMLEAGVIDNCEAVEMTGTSSGLLMGFDRFCYTPNMAHQFASVPGAHITYGSMNSTGACYKWFKEELYNKNGTSHSYEQMDEEILANSPNPTKIIFHPYMMGERCPIWNSNARGTFIGMDLSTSRADLMRAVLEGVGYALRDNMEEAKKAGLNVSRVYTVGGCSKSMLWNEIKASILNVPFGVPASSKGAVGGLGILLAVFMGEFENVREAVAACACISRTVMPNKAWVKHYDEMYALYKETYNSLEQCFYRLGKV